MSAAEGLLSMNLVSGCLQYGLYKIVRLYFVASNFGVFDVRDFLFLFLFLFCQTADIPILKLCIPVVLVYEIMNKQMAIKHNFIK